MIKEVGFLPVRRYEIPAGELLFNTPYCFLPVRFGYGNQLLALLGLSHWLFIAVLDLLGFPTNFYDRHYFFLFICLIALPTTGRVMPYGFSFFKGRAFWRLGNARNRLITSPVFGLKPDAALRPAPKGAVFLLDGASLLACGFLALCGFPCPGLGSVVLGLRTFLRGSGIYSSCESGGNRSGTYDCERCDKPNTYALI